MFTFLEEEDGVVGIFDATNSTFERRAWVREECKARGIKLLFLESICNTPEVIAKNVVAAKTHGNPDYKSVKDEEAIIRDFQQRVSMYEKRYQTVSVEEQVPHIKTINQGEELRLFRIEGWVPSRITFFLMNMKVRSKRRVWLCRHGESEYNVRGILGGDSCLSERGKQFSHRLNDYILTKVGADCPDNEVPYIWTSTLQRTKLTALHLAKRYPLLQWKCLEEIDAGICDSMTQEEIDAKYPEIAAARKKEKFTFRYPQGESYQDLILRSQPALLQMENSERDLVIIVHNAVVRMFYAYFNDIDPELVTTLDIPLHRVYEFVALPHGQYQMTYEDLDIDGPGSVQD
jgi:6-phosphofructo-2-kinase/fructose-2,6-biphosphatase 2